MGRARRRRSYSDSSASESESESVTSESSESSQRSRERGPSRDRCKPEESASEPAEEDADNWVLCDRCAKWRRIPVGYTIAEDQSWYCELNPDKAFASCSAPQELTDAEIDAGGDSGESDLDEEESQKRRRIPAVWQLLKDNVLAHRKRKVQDEDDIMICHCKPTWRGGDGCGPDCINRMLCIECVPGFCPSEDKCTNQMFSKKMYAKLEIRRAGAKGFGLFALEDIKAGQFIIEYIGEVLEEDEYQRRKDYYMSVGQRHYYFMNIGNGEVIDAARKGNISRFINHSCEPNCETQKWLVRGELAIGLFAVRDIPKETELTFDYNFERYGDKPMRCYCRSGGCRKFIGGQQDNFDVSLLPTVETVEDASLDLPPVMLTDPDMDPNMRMLLDWRVGAKVEKAKELGMVTRLERLCKSRNVNWTVRHFYGQEPRPAPQEYPHELQTGARPAGPSATGSAGAPSTSGQGEDKAGEAASAAATPTPALAKGKQARKAEKVAAAAAAAAGTAGKGKAAGAGGAKAQTEGATHAAGVAKLRIDDAGGSGAAATPAPTPSAKPATTPEVTQVRGPKALFKQWKIMQQQETPAPAAEEKPAAAPSSPPSPPSPHSQSPHSPRSSPPLEDEDVVVDESVRAAAATAAKHVPLRKRLRRLPPKPPPAPAAEATPAPAQNGGGAAATAPSASKRPEPPSASAPARKPSFTSPAGPSRSPSPPPVAGAGRLMPSGPSAAGGGGSARKLRSEIDRRLDEVVGASGRLKDPSRQNIIKVLRLFNLCDIGGHAGRNNGFGPAAGGRYLNGRRGSDDAGPGPGSMASGALTARQRARMADLSLLLDVVLKTTSSAAKKEFVACGLLTQLHQAMGRNTGKEYCVILRKVLRAVESLPLEANDVYAVRSAHGTLADMLRTLSTNTDYDVRTKAAALLKKFPPSAVTDQRLLQILAAPPVRFGGGGGGRGGGGAGGMRMGFGPPPGGMMPLAMQQQYLQQQQLLQQQVMKHQAMLRMKEAAAAAGGGLPPPPPLEGAAAEAAAAAAGTSAGLLRTSSTASLEGGDPLEADGMGGGGGPPGLPPLGPSRQRAMVAAAAAAALAARPGLMRPHPSRPGAGGLGMPNGMGMAMGGGGGGRAGMMGLMGMGPSPLGLPPRPPSPATAEAYAAYNAGGGGGPNDDLPPFSKRRKHAHGMGMGMDGDGGYGALPGPPPRPPFGHHAYHGHPHGGYDPSDREPPGPPLLPGGDLPLPPPPPLGPYGLGGGRCASEERDPLPDLPQLLSAEQLFALQRPLARPPPLPPLQGVLQPERHVHGQLTDSSTLFALNLYGSFRPGSCGCAAESGMGQAAPAAADAGEDSAASASTCCWSPLACRAEAPLSPVLEPPAALPAGGEQLPGPPGAAGATPVEGTALRPLRTTSALQLAGGPGPSPYHQQGSPATYGAWEGAAGPGGGALGLGGGGGGGSTTSTPTVSGFGTVGQAHGGFGPPASAPSSATAATAAAAGGPLPPVVPISSLSDWRPAPAAAEAASAAPATSVAGVPIVPLAGGVPVVPLARASPTASPEHGSAAARAAAAAAAAAAEENIDEWLRPVSSSHAETWDEPDGAFEAYVADMVRHRLGKYMQPEHPSRVSVAEATSLRAKVYREVVAKERRAWEERRSAGVFKPIERHKLEANLKEFVRSTIKRMRDREKEKAGGGGGGGGSGATPGGGHVQGHAAHGHAHGHGRGSGAHAHPPQQPVNVTPLRSSASALLLTGTAGRPAPSPSPAPDLGPAAGGGDGRGATPTPTPTPGPAPVPQEVAVEAPVAAAEAAGAAEEAPVAAPAVEAGEAARGGGGGLQGPCGDGAAAADVVMAEAAAA